MVHLNSDSALNLFVDFLALLHDIVEALTVERQLYLLLFQAHAKTLRCHHGKDYYECINKVEAEAERKPAEPKANGNYVINEDRHREVQALVRLLHYKRLGCNHEWNV